MHHRMYNDEKKSPPGARGGGRGAKKEKFLSYFRDELGEVFTERSILSDSAFTASQIRASRSRRTAVIVLEMSTRSPRTFDNDRATSRQLPQL